jgi:mannose-6-phosphate isomerase
VLRGGLSPKHIDVPELLNVLDFNPRQPDILPPIKIGRGEECYPSDAEEFVLSRIETDADQPLEYSSGIRRRSPEILFCSQGQVRILVHGDENKVMAINKGESVFVPASAGSYSLIGPGKLFKAAVNLKAQ